METMDRKSYMDQIADELRRFNPNSGILRLWEAKPIHRYTETEERENAIETRLAP